MKRKKKIRCAFAKRETPGERRRQLREKISLSSEGGGLELKGQKNERGGGLGGEIAFSGETC